MLESADGGLPEQAVSGIRNWGLLTPMDEYGNDDSFKEDDIQVVFESEELREADDSPEEEADGDFPHNLPVMALHGLIVFPYMWVPLTVGQSTSLKLIQENMPVNRHVLLAANLSQEEARGDAVRTEDVARIGTVCVIHRVMRAPDGMLRVLMLAQERCRIEEFTQEKPYLRADISRMPETEEQDADTQALMHVLQTNFRKFVKLDQQIPSEVVEITLNAPTLMRLTYMIASSLPLDPDTARSVLEEDSVKAKANTILTRLLQEIQMLELGRQIQNRAQGELEKNQKEFLLREQIRAINRELGQDDEQLEDITELEASIVEAKMSELATKEAMRELDRLRRVPIQAAEYSVIKSYIEALVSLPWNVTSSDSLDLRRARRILNEDHYGLVDIKDRIMEYLAVRKLRLKRRSREENEMTQWDKVRREREGVVLCFVGPPGVGKTSLGISIARAMKRQFVRLALGGVRDEAEIRGFRRTYVGSMPGRVIQSLRRCGTKNPVFMLDEVDKLGRDFRGDPSSALLEVLDPEQNREFTDHYLDVPFDLSNVMFITTANTVDAIPIPLRDRMEIIQLSSYTEAEKVKIAQNYLLPRQIRENGLRENEIGFTKGAMQAIVRGFTNEAGVRELERMIAKLCRQTATQIATGGQSSNVRIQKKHIGDRLGKPKFLSEHISQRTELPGVATGLAWTMTGGDVLFIESTIVPGENRFKITGQLGDVMRESGEAALSFIRSRAHELGIASQTFRDASIHVHVPAGSIPKDGPSAGITMATSLASLLTRRPVKRHVGMTGEITLRGKVLPVGGIKEKVLAAERIGLSTILLPHRNEADLDDIPDAIRRKLDIVLVDTVDDVFASALEQDPDYSWRSPLDGEAPGPLSPPSDDAVAERSVPAY